MLTFDVDGVLHMCTEYLAACVLSAVNWDGDPGRTAMSCLEISHERRWETQCVHVMAECRQPTSSSIRDVWLRQLAGVALRQVLHRLPSH